MKNIIGVLAISSLFVFGTASAAELTCPEGQVVASVMTDPGVVGTPAVTHTVHHDEVSHVVHHDAVTHQVFVSGHFVGSWPHLVWVPGHFETIVDSLAWDETVVDSAAYDEEVVDVPAVMAVAPTYEDQCVVDPGYVPPVEVVVEAPKPITGGTQPFCSSPSAPGWNVSLPGGGCSTGLFGSVAPIFFNAGETVKGILCPFWFGSIQCVIK